MFHFSWGIFDMTHRAYDDKIYNITNRLFDISVQPNVFRNMCNIYSMWQHQTDATLNGNKIIYEQTF